MIRNFIFLSFNKKQYLLLNPLRWESLCFHYCFISSLFSSLLLSKLKMFLTVFISQLLGNFAKYSPPWSCLPIPPNQGFCWDCVQELEWRNRNFRILPLPVSVVEFISRKLELGPFFPSILSAGDQGSVA